MATDKQIYDGMRAGRPEVGPVTVRIDVTNTCNAHCLTCPGHSPLLDAPRPDAWKQRAMPAARFFDLLDQLEALDSVRQVTLTGGGEPLLHPDIYAMMRAVTRRGWKLHLQTSLVPARIQTLVKTGVERVLVGVHGPNPDTYVRFHPGWTEKHFFAMCRFLRELSGAGVRVRHHQLVNRDTVADVQEMVMFGKIFTAERVDFSLPRLDHGTEISSITQEQLDWLLDGQLEAIRALAAEQGVATNVDVFERQLREARGDVQPAPPSRCRIGQLHARITEDGQVFYCDNPAIVVGSLDDASFAELWSGAVWQQMRDRLEASDFLPGCEACPHRAQNQHWDEKFARAEALRAR